MDESPAKISQSHLAKDKIDAQPWLVKLAENKLRSRRSIPNAAFVQCAVHRLNLVVNDLNSIAEVRKFFRESPKRRSLVSNVSICETRWTAKYQSIRIFTNHFEDIHKQLGTWLLQLLARPAKMHTSCNAHLERRHSCRAWGSWQDSDVVASDTNFASCST